MTEPLRIRVIADPSIPADRAFLVRDPLRVTEDGQPDSHDVVMVTFGGGPAAETPIEARPDFDDVPDDLLDIVRRVVAEDATDILPAKRAIAELVEWYRERGGK